MGRARQLAGRGDNDTILMDASAASTDENEKLLLDGTDSVKANAGFNFLQEDFGTDVSYDNLDPNIRELPSDAIYFQVSIIAAQIISHNTGTKIAYDKVVADYKGNANMAADPSRFTCTVPGLYWFKNETYNSHTAHNSIMTYYYSYLYLNGNYMNYNARTQTYGGGSGFNHHMYAGTNYISQITWLNVGDYIEGRVYIYKTGGTLQLDAGVTNPANDFPSGTALTGYLVKRLPI